MPPVLDTATSWWSAESHAYGRVLKDMSGNRRHMFPGVSRPCFIDNGYLDCTGGLWTAAITPDAAALDITGDIELEVDVALDSYASGAIQYFIAKQETTTTRSYWFDVNGSGTLRVGLSGNGSETPVATSSVAISTVVTAGQRVKLLGTWRQSDGRVQFFYRLADTDAWTKLGADATLIPTGGFIFSSTSRVSLGAYLTAHTSPMKGRLYAAKIRNGLGGTEVANVNFTTWRNEQTSGYDAAGNLWSIFNARSTVRGGAFECSNNIASVIGSDFFGTNGNPALDVTGDVELIACVSMEKWATGTSKTLLSKYTSGVAGGAYRLDIAGTGQITLYTNDTADTAYTAGSGTFPVPADGQTCWIRAAQDINDGAGNRVTTFYYSLDPPTTALESVSWTLVSTITQAGALTALQATKHPLNVASSFNGGTVVWAGRFFKGYVRNGIGGPIVASPDFTVVPNNAMFFKDLQGNEWGQRLGLAIPGNDPQFLAPDPSGNPYLYMPGVAANYLASIDHPDFDITGDIDIRWYGALNSYTVYQVLVSKWGGGALSYLMAVTSTGHLQFGMSVDGVSALQTNSTDLIPAAAGALIGLRVTRVQSTGLLTYWHSHDFINWTAFSSKTYQTGNAIFNSNNPIHVGQASNNTSAMTGRVYAAQVRNGVNGTVVFDWTLDKAGVRRDRYWPDPSTTNLLDKESSDFETGPGQWNGFQATLARSTVQAFQGTASLAITSTAAGTAQAFLPGAAWIPVSPGEQVSLTARTRAASTGRTSTLQLNWYDATGTLVTSVNSNQPTNSTTAWTECSISGAVAPAGAAFIRIVMQQGSTAVNEVHYWDAVSVQFSATPSWQAGGKPIWLVRSAEFTNGNARKPVVVEKRSVFLLGGDDYFAANDDPAFDFPDNLDVFTVAVAHKRFSTGAAASGSLPLLAKRTGLTAAAIGYVLYQANPNTVALGLSDGTTTVVATDVLVPAESNVAVGQSRASDIRVMTDGTWGATTGSAIVGSLANAEELRIGRYSGATTNYLGFEFYGAAIWRSELSDTQIAALHKEFFPRSRTVGVLVGGTVVQKPVYYLKDGVLTSVPA